MPCFSVTWGATIYGTKERTQHTDEFEAHSVNLEGPNYVFRAEPQGEGEEREIVGQALRIYPKVSVKTIEEV